MGWGGVGGLKHEHKTWHVPKFLILDLTAHEGESSLDCVKLRTLQVE